MAGGRRAVNSNGTYVKFWSRSGTIDELARHRMSSASRIKLEIEKWSEAVRNPKLRID
jgi:hypothetical protein